MRVDLRGEEHGGVLRACHALDAGSEVHRRPDHREFLQLRAADDARDDGAPVDADAHAQYGQASRRAHAILLLDRGLHGEGRVRGIVRLPGIRLVRAEQRHQTVADELRDVPAMVVDDPAHAAEVLVQHAHQDLRLEPRAERREAHQVGEEDRHLPAFGGRGTSRGDAIDQLPRCEACERALQALELACRGEESPAEPPCLASNAPPGAAEPGGRCEGAERQPRAHAGSSTSTAVIRQSALASAAMPTVSTKAAWPSRSYTTRPRR